MERDNGGKRSLILDDLMTVCPGTAKHRVRVEYARREGYDSELQ